MGAGYGADQSMQSFYNAGQFFQIILDNANYHEGSIVNGNLQFDLASNQTPIEVYVSIIGYERVYWRERQTTGMGDRRRTRTVTIKDSLVC